MLIRISDHSFVDHTEIKSVCAFEYGDGKYRVSVHCMNTRHDQSFEVQRQEDAEREVTRIAREVRENSKTIHQSSEA